MNDIKTILWACVKSSVLAGQAILEVYDTDFEVEHKSDNSPLTMADKKAHAVITDILSENFPDYPILSEEGKSIPYSERKNWSEFFLVDPLDGTKEFVKRNDEFTVNIALIKGQNPVMGVVYVPVKDRLYFGAKNIGAYKAEKARQLFKDSEELELFIKSSIPLPLEKGERPFTVVASRSHLTPETEKYIEELKTSYGEIETVSAGSSLKLCLVVENKADVYPRFAPTMEWDTGAGHAVVISAGGSVTDPETKKPLIYNKENLLNPWFLVSSKEFSGS